MFKIRIEDLKHYIKTLNESQAVFGCDGDTRYTIRRKGEYLLFQEVIR